MIADDLIKLIAGLRAPFGLERSVKIVPGELLDDRCLISLHRNALGAKPLLKLLELANAQDMPGGLEGEFETALSRAEIVHFGHEAGPDTVVRKIYFEFAEEARRAMASKEPALVHLAYKWSPGRAEPAAVTRYRWAPYRTRAEAFAWLSQVLPPTSAPRALQIALLLLSHASALLDAGELPMMEVSEVGNPRRSCDINVYSADLRLADVANLIETAAREFDVAQSRLEAVFDGAGRLELGHLSAGLDRNGREFVTFYYGVEPR